MGAPPQRPALSGSREARTNSYVREARLRFARPGSLGWQRSGWPPGSTGAAICGATLVQVGAEVAPTASLTGSGSSARLIDHFDPLTSSAVALAVEHSVTTTRWAPCRIWSRGSSTPELSTTGTGARVIGRPRASAALSSSTRAAVSAWPGKWWVEHYESERSLRIPH